MQGEIFIVIIHAHSFIFKFCTNGRTKRYKDLFFFIYRRGKEISALESKYQRYKHIFILFPSRKRIQNKIKLDFKRERKKYIFSSSNKYTESWISKLFLKYYCKYYCSKRGSTLVFNTHRKLVATIETLGKYVGQLWQLYRGPMISIAERDGQIDRRTDREREREGGPILTDRLSLRLSSSSV